MHPRPLKFGTVSERQICIGPILWEEFYPVRPQSAFIDICYKRLLVPSYHRRFLYSYQRVITFRPLLFHCFFIIATHSTYYPRPYCVALPLSFHNSPFQLLIRRTRAGFNYLRHHTPPLVATVVQMSGSRFELICRQGGFGFSFAIRSGNRNRSWHECSLCFRDIHAQEMIWHRISFIDHSTNAYVRWHRIYGVDKLLSPGRSLRPSRFTVLFFPYHKLTYQLRQTICDIIPDYSPFWQKTMVVRHIQANIS